MTEKSAPLALTRAQSNSLLAHLEQAVRWLAEATDVPSIKRFRDDAEAARVIARQRDLGRDAENHGAEIRVRAERRLGELLSDREQLPRLASGENLRPPGVDHPHPPTLKDLGLSHYESQTFRDVAAVPEPIFEEEIATRKAERQPISTNTFVRLGREVKAAETAAIVEHALDTPEAQARMAVANLRRSFSNAQAWLRGNLLLHDPSAIAHVLDPDDAAAARHFIADTRAWLEELERALDQPIHVIGGQRHA
jgi:hypothetical protein